MDHKPKFPIEEEIRLAEWWARPEYLPPGPKAGQGNGWRHTCYRLAQHIKGLNHHIKNQDEIINRQKSDLVQCEETIDYAIKFLRSKQRKQ